MNKRIIGNNGEKIAASFLLEQGYAILERQFRTKVGEIDIVAEKDSVTVFVEVKLRSSFLWGSPAESVNRKKQMKIIKVAQLYLQKTGKGKNASRFDVIEILNNQEAIDINHIVNAFSV